MVSISKERLDGNQPDAVREALKYLRSGGLGEVIGITSFSLEFGHPKIQSDTAMAMALCLLAQDALDAANTEPVAVKPLDWREVTSPREDGPPEPTGDFDAISPIGTYYIEMYFGSDSYGWEASLNGEPVADKDNPEDAKAAAQVDYEARIRSALTHPAPAVREGWKPTHWALYSVSGSHIGLWQDETWVERLQAQYPGSTILPLATAPEAK